MPVPFKHISTFFLLLLTLAATNAQTSYHINTAETMNTAMLTSIIHDRNDNMWIGTVNGLFKHEGLRIREFTKVGTGSNAISGGEMHTMMEDRNGFIWIGTTNGLDKINPVTYAVTHYPLRSKDSLSSFVGYIYSVFQDAEDYIWASTDAAMFRMNYKTGEYETVTVSKDKNGLPSHYAAYKSGINTPKGLWIHTLEGMAYYEYATKRFYHRWHNPQNKAIFRLNEAGRGNQSDLRIDRKNNLWFVSNDRRLIRYNTETERLDSFSFIRPPGAWYCCYSVAVDKMDNVWIGFRHGGLQVLHQQTKTFQAITTATPGSLIQSNYIYSLEEDYQGKMWATTDNGLDIIDLYNTAATRIFLSDKKDFTNLQHQMATPTTDGEKFLYVPFYRYGFLQVNLLNDSVRHFKLEPTGPAGTTYIIPVNNNLVWAARDRKLNAFDLTQNKIITTAYKLPIPNLPEGIQGDIIWHYCNDSTLVYKTSRSDVFYQRPDGITEHLYGYGFKKNIGLSPDKETLWFVDSSLNLVKKNLITHQASLIHLQQKLKSLNFSFSNPRDLVDDGQSVWMTGQNGLLRYVQASDKIISYSVEKGLSNSFTFSLALDHNKNLWSGSISGIDVYDRQKDFFRNIISHPSQSYMDAFGGSVITNDGKLYFVSGNKLFKINAAEAMASQKDSSYKLLVQEVLINGEPTGWAGKELVSLDYTQNRVLFRFGLLDFTKQKAATYFYYLEALEKEWIENVNPGEVSYNALPPGNYVFHLQCRDASGKLLATELKIPIRIAPPFWQRWWFRVAVLAFICFLLYLFYKQRIRKIRREASIKQQLTELESKALRAQMNPHFIFNSLNAIQELIVTKNVTEAYQYLSSFSKLLRMVLNNSEKNFIPLSEEIEMNRHYLELESLRFKKSFYYELKAAESIDEETTLVPSLLLQPFIENAIWHGLISKEGDKRLEINFTVEGENIICVIEDNGIGREKSAAIKAGKIGANHFESKGMKLSHQRIELLNQHLKEKLIIKVEDLKNGHDEAAGTRVVITIPNQTSFKANFHD